MSKTRELIDRSVEETKRALNALSHSQLELARDRVRRELEGFIQNEWLGATPNARTLAQLRLCEIWRAQ